MKHRIACLLLALTLVGCDQLFGEPTRIRFTASGPVAQADEGIIQVRLSQHTPTLSPTYIFSKTGSETVILTKGIPTDTDLQYLLQHRGVFTVKSEYGLPWLSNKDIVDATAGIGDQQRPALHLQLSPEGTARLARLSARGDGTVLKVELDGELLSSPRVTGPITQGRVMFSLGDKTSREASLLATVLKTGPLSIAAEHIHTEAIH